MIASGAQQPEVVAEVLLRAAARDVADVQGGAPRRVDGHCPAVGRIGMLTQEDSHPHFDGVGEREKCCSCERIKENG